MLLGGCATKRIPRYLKEEFRGIYAPSVGSTDRLQTQGFYRDIQIIEALTDNDKLGCRSFALLKSDTGDQRYAASDVMFFTNGMCLVGFLNRLDPDLDHKRFSILDRRMRSSSKSGYIQSIVNEFWGVYFVKGDTLTIKVMDRSSLNQEIGAFEQSYKILDENTLMPLFFKPLSKECCPHYRCEGENINRKFYLNASFHAINAIQVDSDYSWLLQKKWFWKNEAQYKEWKKRVYQK